MSGSDPGDPVVLFEQLYQQERAAVIESQKAALNAALTEWLLRIRGNIDDELRVLGYDHHHYKHQIVLLQPILQNLETGALIMADFPLPLNETYTAVLTLFNPTTSTFDTVSATDVFTATPSDTTNASCTVAPFVPPTGATASQIALAGLPAITFGWLHSVTPLLTGITVDITDSAGNTPYNTLSFAMLPASAVPDQIGVDAADAVLTTVPTPV